MAFCVFTSKVSILNLACHLGKATKSNDIEKSCSRHQRAHLKAFCVILKILLSGSGDFNSDSHSSTFDDGASVALKDNFINSLLL